MYTASIQDKGLRLELTKSENKERFCITYLVIIVRSIAKVHNNYRMLLNNVKRELRHRVKGIRRPSFVLYLLHIRIFGKWG
ncbi:MAG: hypothetical protein JO327_04645 [Nitrososphaeraceae archaeon]|nr:hypothetical protein [Nitrososphaeraceae archaeon]MBV9667400.1 hypothetical protein [Nitrososphaeraceae archaeon]